MARRRFEGDLLRHAPFRLLSGVRDCRLRSGEAITYVSYAGGKPVAVLFGPTGDGAFHAVLIGFDMDNFGR